jgi:hypothetical protein
VEPGVQLGVVHDDGAQHDVAVAGEVLGDRVHDDVRAQAQRTLPERGGERVVHGDRDPGGVRGVDQGREVGDLEHRVGG